MFLALGGGDGNELFKKLGQQSNESMLEDDLVFVGWDKPLIEKGDYFFGFSHYAYDEISIPDGTFRFTSLRDPVERVVSHYRMLLDFSKQVNPHPCFTTEGQWLGGSFDEFLDRLPMQHLKNQLYMFSEDFHVSQAVERIQNLDFCFFVDTLEIDLRQFARKTSISLTNRRDRISEQKFQLNGLQSSRLREMLSDEYELVNAIRDHRFAFLAT